jgi:hypothetical protein
MRFSIVAVTVALLCHATARVHPSHSTDHTNTQQPARAEVEENGVEGYGSIFTRQEPAFFDDDLASAEDFKKATDKGGALTCAMAGTDRTAGLMLKDTRTPPSAASVWTGDLRQELSTWYWHSVDTSSKACQINEFWKLSYAMQVLGLDGKPTANGGDNECFRIEHWDPQKYENDKKVPAINQWYIVGDRDYRVSLGTEEFVGNAMC